MNNKNNERVYAMSFAGVYPHYVEKARKKGRSTEEVNEIIYWLTGYNEVQLIEHLENNTTFKDFFEQAEINPNAEKIKGVICGYRIEDIEEPLMKQIRYLDKMIDELAKGKAMEKILRS